MYKNIFPTNEEEEETLLQAGILEVGAHSHCGDVNESDNTSFSEIPPDSGDAHKGYNKHHKA